jgi:predicted acylesterase/phospholipase RssA
MSSAQSQAAYAAPQEYCDIVMKGGITSGVVYPLAVTSLAKKYRLSNIGGTSAGAIAAAAAAAAEYGRLSDKGGFARLATVPDEVGPRLKSLFQPTPPLKPVFDIFVALLESKSAVGKIAGVLRAAFLGYRKEAIIGGSLGFFLAALLIAQGVAFWPGLFLLILLVTLGAVVALVWRLITAFKRDLADNDYGLCPGIRQQGFQDEAFTDWLARLIDEAADRAPDTPPLTFGDLKKPPQDARPITLMMMTTSLMEKRPYTLPLDSGREGDATYGFVFEIGEWKKLFPDRVIDYLLKVCERDSPSQGESGEFYRFPHRDDLPVVVAARMSLSFPGLISAVPLWRRDPLYRSKVDQETLRRCLFSDGGLSSNFPIHFFDKLLPNTPTFAISLDAFDPKRHDPEKGDGRIWMFSKPREGARLPILPFSGLGDFLFRLVDAAKDWQDNLQSVLPGYRERIVHVGLSDDEGGLNIAMKAETVRKLVALGERAGERLVEFNNSDMDAHRWRRFLVAMARMEQTLDDLTRSYEGVAQTSGPSVESFHRFLERYPALAREYKQGPEVLSAMLTRAAELAKIGAQWRDAPTVRSGKIPHPDTNLRITAKP